MRENVDGRERVRVRAEMRTGRVLNAIDPHVSFSCGPVVHRGIASTFGEGSAVGERERASMIASKGETPRKSPARASGLRERPSEVRELGRVRDAARWLSALAPRGLPPGVQCGDRDGASRAYRVGLGGESLGVSIEIDCYAGKLWAHLAITWCARPPTVAMIAWLRDVFLGGRGAVWRLPRKGEELDHTLHVYAPLEGGDMAPGALEETQ